MGARGRGNFFWGENGGEKESGSGRRGGGEWVTMRERKDIEREIMKEWKEYEIAGESWGERGIGIVEELERERECGREIGRMWREEESERESEYGRVGKKEEDWGERGRLGEREREREGVEKR